MPVNGFTIVPIFVVVEFCYYWFHRTSHRVRWFWAAHVPHHSGEVMNFTTAMRQSLLNAFVGVFVFYLPPVWLGIPPAVVLFLLAVDLAYQYFVHTEAIGRLPRGFEYVFDTPSNHRAHHGRNPRYIDRNYGGVLIIFDRLFGTYVEETEPVDYGITQQIRSTNFLVLNLHEFVDMWRDVFAPRPAAAETPVDAARMGAAGASADPYVECRAQGRGGDGDNLVCDARRGCVGSRRKIVQATGTRSG